MKRSDLNAKFIAFINDKVMKYENILIALILVVLVLNSFDHPFIKIFNTIILSSIAMIYIFSAYKDLSDSEFTQIDTFFHKLSGFASAVALIGFLFSLQKFPNSKNMLVVGGITLLVSFIYILAKGTVQKFGIWFVIRLLTIILIASKLLLEQFL